MNTPDVSNKCVCLEHVGDNGYCPVHGEPPKDERTREAERIIELYMEEQ